MSDNPNRISEGLTREQLLSALDSEISEREDYASRLGYSDWALKGAFVAILWTAVNEIAEGNHTWRGTLLIFFVGWVMLMLLSIFTADYTLQPTYKDAKGNERFGTFREVLVRRGIHSAMLPYLIAETLALLAIAVALGYYGFVTLSVVAGVILSCILIAFIFVLGLTYIRLPIRIDPEIERHNPTYMTYAKWGLLVAALALLVPSINNVVGEWSNITKGDLRLGLLLTALLTVLGINVRLARPAPDLAPLKSIRSRFAFGWLDLEAAKNEIENILLGFPKDHYVASKAIQLIEILKHVAHLHGESLAGMQEIISLTTSLKGSQDKQPVAEHLRKKIVQLNRRSYYKLKATLKLWDRALQLRKRLDLRLRIAKLLLDITDEEIKDLLTKVAEACETSDRSREAILNLHQTYMKSMEAWRSLCLEERDTKNSLQRYRELFEGLFRE